ncbi:SRPBCC family protein [Stappia sp.]|jgi:uncharacterized protein YndB with AHSA1/START domain|uniref:SRPBCC family protein n=1 Tax=Stappia sp. TaxID=1870903 RepID=UPI003D09E202
MNELRDEELLIEREFDAPLALVFRLWESRDHMLRWWGPEKFTTTELDWELTPGRPWRGAMVSKQYGLSRFGGVIRDVERLRRIVFTFQWDEGSGRDLDTLVTVSFAEKDGRTVQSFHQAPFSSVAIRDSHVGGWNSLFNRQQAYVENIAVAEEKGLRT